MKKTLYFASVMLASVMLLFSACTQGGESEKETEGRPTDAPTESVKGADDIIDDAEKTAHISGDADEDALYNAGELPFGSVVPAFLQTHTPDEFPSFEGDPQFFTPTSDDYLIASFEEGKTAIYEFFHDGSLLAIRGRIVYDSKEALLQANSDKELEEDACSEDGYTYHGNVLYYLMRADALFAAGYRIDKIKLLRTAASGAWDDDLYWFSKPYDDPVSAFDSEKWDEVLSVLDAVIPDPESGLPDETGQSDENGLSEETVRELFTDLMKKNKKTPDDYADSDLKIVMNHDGNAYASLLFYTVPEDYVPGGKIENFLISAPLSFDADAETWEIGDQKAFFRDEKDTYYNAVLSGDAYDAMKRGSFVKRLWVPFRPADPVLFKGIVAGKAIEVYETEDNELAVTLFFSNKTGKDVRITTLDSLVLTCESGVVADVSADLMIDLPAGQFMYETVLIPPEYLSISTFSDVTVREFLFSVGE